MKNVRELLQVNEEPLPRLYCDMDQVLCCILKRQREQITRQTFKNQIEILVGKTISNVKDFGKIYSLYYDEQETTSKNSEV